MSLVSGVRIFGKKIYTYAQVKSTDKIACQLAEQGAEEGTLVVAEEQIEGEGRAGHYWFSPQGGLWLSLILRPPTSFCVSRLSILGAIGIARSVRKMFSLLSPRIRWPNDAIINGKKVGGVLCKARSIRKRVIFVIMGIGVNINIEEFPSPLCFTATSLKREIGHSVSNEIFQECLLEELERLYFSSQNDFSSILEEIRGFSSLLGKQGGVQTREGEFLGVVQDIDEEGGLILRLESGMQKRISSEEGYIVDGI